MILLDTSFLIDLFRGVESTKELAEEDSVTTTISYHEIMTGIKRKRAPREEKYFTRFFSEIALVPFNVQAADCSSEISAKLSSIGRKLNALDILIAGIALANGISDIVTRDPDFSEIEKVSDLKVVDY